MNSLRLPSSSVFVSDIPKLVNAVLRYEQRDGEGLDGRVSPASIVDSASFVDVLDIVSILGRPPYIQIGHLKVVVEDVRRRPPEFRTNGAPSGVVVDGRPQAYNASTS